MANIKSNNAVKAGFWYIICNLITNGMYFFTTPIFTRILSKEDYGIAATYQSYLNILTIIATLDLYSCIQLSKVEYEKESKEFLSSILCLSCISTGAFYLLCRLLLLIKPNILGIPTVLLDILFAEILFRNAYTLLQTQHRAFLRYKEFVGITIFTSISGQLLSALLVMNFSENQYLWKILGTAIPFFIVGTVIILLVFFQGKTFLNKEYWIFGLKISVPLIPHHLSGNLLTQFDKIVINLYIGANYTASYSLACNYALIVQVFWNSLNNAWIPWFYEEMKKDNIATIRRFVKPYALLFSFLVIGAVAIGPEIIFLLGGNAYADSIHAIPPIILGVYFQFLYSLYSNIEFYRKKTAKLAVWTVTAAICNVVLNLIFVPLFGYCTAAYTTLISYMILFLLHYRTAKKLEPRDIYCKRFLGITTMITVLLTAIIYSLYKLTVIRYLFIILFMVIGSICIFRKRKVLIDIFNAKTK